MSNVTVDVISLVKFEKRDSLRIQFSNQRGHAIELKHPMSPKEIAHNLIKLGQQILNDPDLKEKE